MNNYPDGMTKAHYAHIDGFHCPVCEMENLASNLLSGKGELEVCDDDAAHQTCGEHTQTKGEYLADQAGV